MAHDSDDPVTNTSNNAQFTDIITARLRAPSRRNVLRGGLGLSALSWMGGGGALQRSRAAGDEPRGHHGAVLHPTGQTSVADVRTVAAEVQREFFAHGVSVIEVNRSAAGAWLYAQNSPFNRRGHTLTVMM